MCGVACKHSILGFLTAEGRDSDVVSGANFMRWSRAYTVPISHPLPTSKTLTFAKIPVCLTPPVSRPHSYHGQC